ncbi:PREDICTED: dolichyl-diphosphooligosaccharide--protein glycosyltransferase subunit DAD1 [Tinamus guttatus]|uniref:dolichyl-diphosphooligosaccharide--protein glycosyltransferase subunit DAD1 n=1 Tax=Tinamus guttatus TaxID=94827 RepID=UPI00052EDBB5|nr:PREDICTED: dolichyl-diphosphooligosaccharide--protein glycosyltransferase subunit DAD1 [Tinamus guttatus]
MIGDVAEFRPFPGMASATAQHLFHCNSFLSGFISAVGSFILGVCLRIQINPQNKGEFQGISPERAFADFLFANTILHLVVINFVG